MTLSPTTLTQPSPVSTLIPSLVSDVGPGFILPGHSNGYPQHEMAKVDNSPPSAGVVVGVPSVFDPLPIPTATDGKNWQNI